LNEKNYFMESQHIKACFTIVFTSEQLAHARSYVADMKKHPRRIFWSGKEGKTDEELIIEQIAHRILSGFYNANSYGAGQQIIKMENLIS
jgi:hypothetical protein